MSTNGFLGLGLFMGIFTSIDQYMSKESDGSIPWYDIYHTYMIFDETYTTKIDELLMKNLVKNGYKFNKCIDKHNKITPAPGTYTYWFKMKFFGKSTVTFIKLKLKNSPNDKETFIYQIKSDDISSLKKVRKRLDNMKDRDEISVISIDTSKDTPTAMTLTKMCKPPRENQIQGLDLIHNAWVRKNYESLKVVLSGKPGVGKTYVARLLKKHIESEYMRMHPQETNHVNVRLYEDFNPGSIGVNVKTMVLEHADKYTPVILIINEIDKYYDEVNNPVQSFDSRLKHTRDVGTFHNMLDDIDSKKNVIAIFTTEKENIGEIESYRSFMRPGRVDLIVNMNEMTSVITRG